jgi:hypothetical protein
MKTATKIKRATKPPTRAQQLKARAQQLSDATQEAYSFTRYGQHEWTRAISLLIERDLGDRQIIAIMCSKWTRWAADNAGRNEGCAKGQDVIDFIDDAKNFGRRSNFGLQLISLVREHFAGEAL